MSEANEPPKRLFLQWGNPGEPPGSVDTSDVTWAGTRVFPGDVKYVRADLAAAATARAEKAERALREIVVAWGVIDAHDGYDARAYTRFLDAIKAAEAIDAAARKLLAEGESAG